MSESDEAQLSSPREIQLDNMSLDQLDQLKQQEEGRLQALTARYSQFRSAAARLHNSEMAVSEFSPALEEKEVMIPLTETLYVPAKVKDANKLLVDLGTGFFAEKSPKETLAFLERKVKLVNANSDNITNVIQVTQHNVQQITMTMQGKLLEIRARQEGLKQQTVDASGS